MTKILVIAKSPIAGRVKTRLCPPCTPSEAASIAEAALRDTLLAATAVREAEPVVVLHGPTGPWLPWGVRVISQRGEGLDERIAAAFCDAGTPALLIGMDTPQLTPMLLTDAIESLLRPGVDAVLGEAVDGGWWAAGLRRADPRAFTGVPMSKRFTHEAQLRRLHALGLRVERLPLLRDVDTFADALAVADEAPHTIFARTVDGVAMSRAAAGSRA
jgi:hypothetical protein